MDLVLKLALIGIEACVGDLAAIVGTHCELLASDVVVQAGDIFPADDLTFRHTELD